MLPLEWSMKCPSFEHVMLFKPGTSWPGDGRERRTTLIIYQVYTGEIAFKSLKSMRPYTSWAGPYVTAPSDL